MIIKIQHIKKLLDNHYKKYYGQKLDFVHLKVILYSQIVSRFISRYLSNKLEI